MEKTFEMSNLGPLHYFLGLEVKQQKGLIFVSQRKYAEDLLQGAGMLNCKPVPTPMNTNEKLQVNDRSGQADATRYRKLVGNLIYLTHTRPILRMLLA